MKKFKYVLIVIVALLLSITSCSLLNKNRNNPVTPGTTDNPTGQDNPGTDDPNTGEQDPGKEDPSTGEDENNQTDENQDDENNNEENNKEENKTPDKSNEETGSNNNDNAGEENNTTGNVDFDLEYNGKRYKLKSNVETILLIGIDKMESNVTGEGYRNGNVADFLVLVVIDHDTGSEQAIHINRECMAPNKVLGVGGDSAGVKYQQVCLAYTYGSGGSDSCINTCEAVSRLLNGITVNHYVRTTMDSVAIITDALGGVTLTIPSDMTAVNADWKKGATVTLDGADALNFCRARMSLGESTNINRMGRQRQFLQALIKKVQSNSGMSSTLVSKVSSHLISDLSNSRLSSLLKSGVFANSGSFYALSGSYTWGNNGAQFAVDYDSMMKIVTSLFYKEVK